MESRGHSTLCPKTIKFKKFRLVRKTESRLVLDYIKEFVTILFVILIV